MNEIEARKELSRRLVFGDEAQIRAIRFLDAVEEVVEAIKSEPECKECHGNGQIYEYDADCEDCGGEGCEECEYLEDFLEDCLFCQGTGHFANDLPECSEDVMKAALDRVRRELRRG